MESHPRRDNFDRAGEIWMKVWTVTGLTCLTLRNSSATTSLLKYAYSALMLCVLLGTAYFRFHFKVIDGSRVILSVIQLHTFYSSLVSSAALIGLTMVNQKKGASMISEMNQLRRKYSLVTSRSVLSYFPASCLFPCLSIIIENISFSALSPVSARFSIMTANCFTLYSFIFCAKMRYYMSMVQDGFRHLNDRLQVLETPTSAWMNDSLPLPGNVAVKKLQQLRLMYHELFAFSRKINEFFASRVILTVVHTFSVGVLFTYNSIAEFINPSFVHRRIPYWLGFAYWAFCCFFNFFVLVQPFESVVAEGRHTAVAVQSLSTRLGYSKEFYEELRLFSSQIISEDIQFAPHSFLVLNRAMLPSVLGAMCSALAILLQMNAGGD